MAMIDMSLVTSTLVRLLDEHVSNSSAWNPAIVLNVTRTRRTNSPATTRWDSTCTV